MIMKCDSYTHGPFENLVPEFSIKNLNICYIIWSVLLYTLQDSLRENNSYKCTHNQFKTLGTKFLYQYFEISKVHKNSKVLRISCICRIFIIVCFTQLYILDCVCQKNFIEINLKHIQTWSFYSYHI